MTYRKKLIEVALPLEAINMESAREKSIRHGHPSTLHLWWARRPLAACRAVLWASLVDDPSSWPDRFPTEEDQKRERQRLFDILGRIVIETDNKGNQKQVVRGLVSWNDVNDPKSKVLENAQREIARCLAWDRGEEPPTKPDAVREYIAKYAPPAYDPFAGGGSIPLEAQRLGLEAHASDLNPVAVLINKALIEIPPMFKDQPPVNPEGRQKKGMSSWKGAQGLSADVHYYGKWLRDEAFNQIGHHYPEVDLPKEYGGGQATVIAWIWARIVKCPNPACGCQMPLVRNFQLSTKKGKEAWVEPVIDHSQTPPTIQFEVASGIGSAPNGTVSRKGAQCIACNQPVSLDYIRSEGKAGRIKTQMMAIVAEGDRRRIYVSPNRSQIEIAEKAAPDWRPETSLPDQALGFRVQGYGMTEHHHLYTERQLLILTTLIDLLSKVRKQVIADALDSDYINDRKSLEDGGKGANAYADAVTTYLAFAIDRLSANCSTLCVWSSAAKNELVMQVFGRQTLSMTWDFGENNPFSQSGGNFSGSINNVLRCLELLPTNHSGNAYQGDAARGEYKATSPLVSTDPPYYDNVPYADLSDYFYVWLRPALLESFPSTLSTLLVPKSAELVADPFRHGSKEKAETFFVKGITETFRKVVEYSRRDTPITIYYAFKQEEGSDEGTASTGWEVFLAGLIDVGFQIIGTWPMRTERPGRLRDSDSNALASSIILVCRPRPIDAPKITRRQFLTELQRELPRALKTLQQGNVAPVDLAQASIGPGMAVFSKYAAVLENDGSPMRVRTALQLINQVLDEFLTEQEGEFDGDTRWALTWFEQYQFQPGQYGDAETLSKAKNTSVQGMVDAGILEAKGGKVRLLKRDELKSDWNPNSDSRMPDWEVTQYLIHELDQQGEMGAAKLLAKLGSRGEAARDLAYRLYSLCDRKGWAQEGIAYNSLVISWPEITRLAGEFAQPEQVQGSLGF
jgi:putative DNA methylase